MTAIKDLTEGFGTIQYNGYTFGPLRNVGVESELVYDEAGWAVTHSKYTLTVHAIIWGATLSAQQAGMANMQKRLSQPGRQLVIDDIGLYTDIDTMGVTPDLMWGVRPRVISLNPAGGDLAWEVVWKCEFNVNLCIDTEFNPQALMALNYSVAYSTNERGLVNRAINGYLQIPQLSRGTATTFTRDIEAFYSRIKFNLPVTMRRLTSTRQISLDRTRMEFSVIDEEMSGPPLPDGIVAGEAQYDWQNVTPKAFLEWHATLTATFEVARGYPRSLAAEKFFLLLFDKVTAARAAAPQDGAVLPTSLKISTDVFGRSTRFSCGFRVTSSLTSILSGSGIWRPMPDASWQSWQASMAAVGLFDPRGQAQMTHKVTDDVIIDICGGVSEASLGNDEYLGAEGDSDFSPIFSCEGINEQNSYLEYNNSLSFAVEQSGTIHRPATSWEGMAKDLIQSATGITIGSPSNGETSASNQFQYEGVSDNLVIMQGSAVRIKYYPELPQLQKVGGLDVEEMKRKPFIEQISTYFECPVYLLKWSILYQIVGQAQEVESPNVED
ncbi:MAG: hypothetical protein WDZ51_16430 [Pirellulaceae bacterium]